MDQIADITRRKSSVDLEIDSAVRRALEAAAVAVERLAGTRHYQYAFKKAARRIRAMKPE